MLEGYAGAASQPEVQSGSGRESPQVLLLDDNAVYEQFRLRTQFVVCERNMVPSSGRDHVWSAYNLVRDVVRINEVREQRARTVLRDPKVGSDVHALVVP